MGILNIISSKRGQYWTAQISGWLLYYILVYILTDVKDEEQNLLVTLFGLFTGRILFTHLYRGIIIYWNWFVYNLLQITAITVLSCLVIGGIFTLYRWGIFELTNYQSQTEMYYEFSRWVNETINSAFVFFLWSALYYIYHYVEKSRIEEIKNLQWQASKNEIELNNLKSQLNPHFMFNSMNSIRALIDEDPKRAKVAVTQLSTILRNTLLMGKSKTVSLNEELNVVKDYLSLEAIRYEERLNVKYDIEKAVLKSEIPPLMIQTLVENAIKHGISKLPEGGDLLISVHQENEKIIVRVDNSGKLDTKRPDIGIGLKNTRERLAILYDNDFNFEIKTVNGLVRTEIKLPKFPKNESYNS